MLFKYFIALAFVLFYIESSLAAECHGKPSPDAKPNFEPIQDANLTLIKEIKNARLYIAGQGEEQIYVIHLWGTPYEMGFAHGSLIKDRISKMVDAFWKYMESEVEKELNKTTKGKFREDFLRRVSDYGLDVALDLEILVTDVYTGHYFLEEIDGMAAATGIDAKKIKRIHLIGELTKGSCSMFGAWGSAVPGGNGLLQLRALDWVTDGGLQDFPSLTVYHPTDSKNGRDFVNIGWSGWIGSIQGFNSRRLSTSEIGVYFRDDTFGKESRFGTPFTYLLRDILQFDDTFDDAKNRITNADRTCDLILGVGDGKSSKFNSVQYSYSVANFMDDTNQKPEADWHPKIENVVYHGMDWLCPGYYEVMGRQLNSLHGNITAVNAIRYVSSIVQSGSLLVVYYDHFNDHVYIANARASYESGAEHAFDRSFVKFTMSTFFKETPPSIQ